MSKSPEPLGLGERLAHWVSDLDHNDDTLLWVLLRFDDRIREHLPMKALHAHAQRMRNGIVPWIGTAQVLEFDAILDDPGWNASSTDPDQFRRAYFSHRRYYRSTPMPLGWASFEALPKVLQECTIADARARGIDL